MSFTYRYDYLRTIIPIFLVVLVNSCNTDNDEFRIGSDFVESQTHIKLIDTFSVELSTVLLDSLITSANENILIGDYEDNMFGKVSCNGYFQVGLPVYHLIQEEDIYDSMTLILYYDGYFYGDTLQDFNISVYQLSEDILLNDDNYLYNTSSFSYDENRIGEKVFRPFPESFDSVEITIHDDIGSDFFDKLKFKDNAFSSKELFLDYFKGITIRSDAKRNKSILGFSADDGEMMLRLYYHRIMEDPIEMQTDFPLINSDKSFYELEYDFSNTGLSQLKSQSDDLASFQMGNKSYVQAGTGLFTKIKFPSMKDILLFDKGVLVSVELVLYPERTSYSEFSLPPKLYLFSTDKINRISNPLYDAQGNYLIPMLKLDEYYHEETCYTFDITYYIQNELSDSYYDPDYGILVGLSADKLYSTLERIVFTDDNPDPKLNIYYLTY